MDNMSKMPIIIITSIATVKIIISIVSRFIIQIYIDILIIYDKNRK